METLKGYDEWKTTPPDCYDEEPKEWEESDEYRAYLATAEAAEASVAEVIGDDGHEITPLVTRQGAALEVGICAGIIEIDDAKYARRDVAEALRSMADALDPGATVRTAEVVADLRDLTERAKARADRAMAKYDVGEAQRPSFERTAIEYELDELAERLGGCWTAKCEAQPQEGRRTR